MLVSLLFLVEKLFFSRKIKLQLGNSSHLIEGVVFQKVTCLTQPLNVSLRYSEVFLCKLCLFDVKLCVVLKGSDIFVGVYELGFQLLQFLKCFCKSFIFLFLPDFEVNYIFFVPDYEGIQLFDFKLVGVIFVFDQPIVFSQQLVVCFEGSEIFLFEPADFLLRKNQIFQLFDFFIFDNKQPHCLFMALSHLLDILVAAGFPIFFEGRCQHLLMLNFLFERVGGQIELLVLLLDD